MMFVNTITNASFKNWLWQESENKRLIIFSALGMIISFTWLKILYPFPNFMPPDSNSYVEAAFNNQFINVWAIGYSKFLRLVSSFSNSHFVLVLLQYVMLIASVLYFLFTIKYLFSPGKWLFRSLLAVAILNPLLVHISNYVASDALFTAISLTWFTQLLWIIYRPTVKTLFWHALIVLIAFMVRYNAIYYPIISISVIFLSHAYKKQKLLGIGLIILLIGSFIGRTQYEYHKLTGTVQYSAFGGWQIAANALYGYAYAKPDDIKDVPGKFYYLHQIVNKHMDSLRRYPPFLRPDKEVAVYYLWDFKSPLRVHMEQRMKKDTSFLKRWASLGNLYSAYGCFLIKKHPQEFIKYYLWPNFIKYYTPPTKFMGAYNMEGENVAPAVANFFGWKSNKLPTYFKDRKITITEPFPVVFAVLNVAFVLGILSYLALGGLRRSNVIIKRIISLTVIIWFSNMAFSVFAAPIELRYQLFPMVMLLAFSWLILAYIGIQALAKPTNLTVQGRVQPALD
jgi:hypothetical protein